MADLEYKYLPPEGEITRHMWTAVGPNGAVHVWAEPTSNGFRDERYYGGVEVHSPKPIYESVWAQEPSHTDCWLLHGPCWHDGTSLYFSERIEPVIRHDEPPFGEHVHSYINAILNDWYQSKFAEVDAA